MSAYYNEIDPYAAEWLRNLIRAGLIATGDVDERSIRDIHPIDLIGYDQCHFFAGIGVWSYALRLAGWPDDRPVWTGSCPCQPFSAAGKQQGIEDDRHLWPDWFKLIQKCQPRVVFGEQVEAAIRHGWLDLVQADMEGIGYAFAAAGIPAAGFGAPHIRQRLWFVAASDKQQPHGSGNIGARGRRELADLGAAGGVADAASGGQREHGSASRSAGHLALMHATGRLGNNNKGLEGQRRGHHAEVGHGQGSVRSAASAGESGGVADDERSGHGEHKRDAGAVGVTAGGSKKSQSEIGRTTQEISDSGEAVRPGPTNGHWRSADWLHCRDGKWRPVEPGTFPLAHGATARVGRLRAYGNAIVPQVAAEVIAAFMAARP